MVRWQVFVESICDSPEVLEANMASKVANSPDFAGMPREDALLEEIPVPRHCDLRA